MKKICVLGLCGLMAMGSIGCASLESLGKDMQSNSKGLHRKVTVVSMDGSEVKTYESKHMRVQDGDGGTITLDFDGKRVVICNAQVIIEEMR